MKNEQVGLEVEEYTEAGTLVPAEAMEWSMEEDSPVGFEEAATVGEEGERLHARIYVEAATGEVLIGLGVFGVLSWIVCRTQRAYLVFVRDWLVPLLTLNRGDVIAERLDELLEMVSEGFNGQEWPGEPERPDRRRRRTQTERTEGLDARPS